MLSNFRLSNCTIHTINDKFTSFCIAHAESVNKALLQDGTLPTEISQVGGNFSSYLNREFWNKQTKKKQSRRSLWSVNYMSKSRKVEA